MPRSARVFISGVLAVGVTLSLFYLMYYLVSNTGQNLGERTRAPQIQFRQVQIEDEIQEKERRKPEEPPPPEEEPPPPEMEIENVNQPVSPLPDLQTPNLDVPFSGQGVYLGGMRSGEGAQEGDLIPLVRIQPQYPRRAALAGIEGWVRVEFTITETGAVADPEVIDSKPPRIFDREAIRAILKWKFKPRVVNGQAVPMRATQTIDFNLDGA